MNAFDDGRVGIWVNSAANLSSLGENQKTRLENIAKFASGMFTDVFLPWDAQRTAYDRVRAQVRPDGTRLKAQMYADPHSLPADTFALDMHQAVIDNAPGVLLMDVEPNGTNRQEATGQYTAYMETAVGTFRSQATWTPRFPLCLNIPPYKGAFLPPIFATDPYLYAQEQTYYGDMSRVSEGEALQDLLDHGVPKSRAGLCYGVVAPDKDGVRRLTLPTVFYQQRPVKKLRRGLVFTDDLMADQGLI